MGSLLILEGPIIPTRDFGPRKRYTLEAGLALM